ncbi:MAG: diadenylate cyclase CdaA [Thermaerobacter sp.]|nr:diadenylate cyclase CdaA [Thermaerobacter sp.]
MLLTLESMGVFGLVRSALDILIVAFLFYRTFTLLRGTRAIQLAKGILLLVVATQLSGILALSATHFLLQTVELALLVAVPIVFQPELRRVLEQLGRSRIFGGQGFLHDLTVEAFQNMLNEVIKATRVLSNDHIGAIIVMERETGLKDLIETGVSLDARLSWEIIANIFTPRTPLHDGAVVVRGDRIVAAACFLPLADTLGPASQLGTRHHAAIGVSEQTDAIAVVVSEETGAVSLAEGGRLIRHLDDASLRHLLESSLRPPERKPLLIKRRA